MTKAGWRQVRREFFSFAIVMVGVSAGRSVLADHYVVPSGSMEPTVAIGDHILVNKLAFGLRLPFSSTYLGHFDGPRRGDVVVLASPDDGVALLKRVAAEPGDLVAVVNGRLVINGVAVPVAYDHGAATELLGGRQHGVALDEGGGPAFGPALMAAGHYLLLGDNRGNSRDSRYFGLVQRDAIRGKAVGVVYRDGFTWREL